MFTELAKVSASTLVRYLAAAFLFLVVVAALVVAVADTIQGKMVDRGTSGILVAAIGYALHALGISTGVNLSQNGSSKDSDNAQTSP